MTPSSRSRHPMPGMSGLQRLGLFSPSVRKHCSPRRYLYRTELWLYVAEERVGDVEVVGAGVRDLLCTHTTPSLVSLVMLGELGHRWSLISACLVPIRSICILINSKIKYCLAQSTPYFLLIPHIMHATTEFAATSATTPLQGSGSLDKFKSFEVTPCIGTEFQDVDLSEWITGSDSDVLLRDLAILSTDRYSRLIHLKEMRLTRS